MIFVGTYIFTDRKMRVIDMKRFAQSSAKSDTPATKAIAYRKKLDKNNNQITAWALVGGDNVKPPKITK